MRNRRKHTRLNLNSLQVQRQSSIERRMTVTVIYIVGNDNRFNCQML